MHELVVDRLEQYRVPGPPSAMYYIPDFISEEEERSILHKIPANRWTSLAHRRLQALPTQLSAKNALIGSPLPQWLTDPVVRRIHDLGVFREAPHGINHCLINEYLPGQGIMPHEDGMAYVPIVATVSLQNSIVLEVTEKRDVNREVLDTDDSTVWRILQEPRSLLLTTGSAYTDTLHGISSVEVDDGLNDSSLANWDLLTTRDLIKQNDGRVQRETRISLTLRDVKKVLPFNSNVFGRR